MNRFVITLLVLFLLTGVSAHAATDNPTVDADTRAAVHQTTMDYVKENTVGGIYRVYDVVTDEIVRLKFKKLHSGIRTTQGFFTSCANFESEDGVHYDMDFLLIQNENGDFAVTQPYVHGVGKQQRPFHP